MNEDLTAEQGEVTALLCQEDELQDGQMREVEVEGQKVLLVRTEGRYGAVGSRCTHYNAPLVKGALVGNRVRCPFHGACFNVMTGDIEEFPGLDCLPSYKVKVEDGNVYISFNRKLSRRVKEMSSREPEVNHSTLLIGGGPAALLCAETLRRNSYQGRIVMVTKDALPPFDKPKLSKALNSESSQILLRSEDFFKQYGIEVWTQKEVGERETNLHNIVFVINNVLGLSTGSRWVIMLEENNVKFYMKDRVLEIRGEDGKVKEVVLESGAVLQADVVVAGIGVVPNSDFLMGSQVQTDSRKAVVVDEFMKTNVPDIYGAGDVTSFPLPIRGGQRVQIGHWQMAHSHGNTSLPVQKPWFDWELIDRYSFGEGYTEIIFKGKVEEGKFLAFYIKEQVVVAAASLMFDPAVSLIAELMSSGHQITKTQAQSEDLSWLKL
uniref:Rieske domain-containing protein n=1 Tax=Gadus morhua TaxID=8049 RepID=A0A8C5BIE1_GADMO